jgi:hypothetical protein
MSWPLDPRAWIPTWPQELLLGEIVAGIARRYQGERVELVVRGRAVSAVLERVGLQRRGRGQRAELELRDAAVDGYELETVSAVARSVRLEAFPASRFVAANVELTGRSALAPLVAWLDCYSEDWSLDVDAGGRVLARHTRHPVEAVVEPTVEGDVLSVELRSLAWRGLRLSLPGHPRLTRHHRLPPIARGLSVVEARRDGTAVDFTLALAEVSERLDVRALNRAVVAGTRLAFP